MISAIELPYNAAHYSTVWAMYLVVALAYCAPTIIGFYRNVEWKWGLYVGNLLLGWTGIGWAYGLYYAIFADKEGAKPQQPHLAIAA